MQSLFIIRNQQRLLWLSKRSLVKLAFVKPKLPNLALKTNEFNFKINSLKRFVNSFKTEYLPIVTNKLLIFIRNFSFSSKDQRIFQNLINDLNLFKATSNRRGFDKIPDFGEDKNNKNFTPPPNPNNNNRVLIVSLLLFIGSLFMMVASNNQIKIIESRRREALAVGSEVHQKTDINDQQNEEEESVPVVKTSTKNVKNLKLHITNGFTITWNDLVTQLIPNKLVSQIYASKNTQTAYISLTQPIEVNGQRYFFFHVNVSPDDIEFKLEKAQDELNIKPEDRVPIIFKSLDTRIGVMNLIILAFVSYVIFSAGRAFFSKIQNVQTDLFSQFTKAKFTVIDPHLKSGVPKISFKDVAGLHEAKIEVREFVEYLRNPERFTKLGGRVPKGALLLGPPGCGKTLLAKAVAAEANVPFFNIAGTEFIEMIGGVGAARVRSLFEEAKKQAPSIIYIDEIDAVGRKRSDSNQMGGSGELDQTLNQLLVSMDGLESNSNVVVLASTNRADILDKALLRPGRLDRHISIDLPTHAERIEILNVHMQHLKLDFEDNHKQEFISRLAHLTPRFSGADLSNICNEAALIAAREGFSKISKNHFDSALERVLAGPEKKTSTISVEDRKMLAYHECGHVIISWFHPYSDLILKVSLLSRTKANVFSQYLPSDSKIFSKEELFDQMCLHFGGRVAESLVFNRFTTNSEQDLKKITKLAYAQIESFGMNEAVGNVSFPTQAEQKATGGIGIKPYSKKLRKIIDLEVNKLVSEAHKQSMETIKNNLESLHKLADELLVKENLSYEDIVRLIGLPKNERRYNLAKITLNTASSIPNENKV